MIRERESRTSTSTNGGRSTAFAPEREWRESVPRERCEREVDLTLSGLEPDLTRQAFVGCGAGKTQRVKFSGLRGCKQFCPTIYAHATAAAARTTAREWNSARTALALFQGGDRVFIETVEQALVAEALELDLDWPQADKWHFAEC